MIIKILYHADITPIEQEESSSWIDLRAAETVAMQQGESRRISLGVSMELPEGYEAQIAPKNSTFSNWGLLMTNGMGIISPGYHSDKDIWAIPVYATKNTVINKNDRICQFRIVKKQPKIDFITANTLGNKDRGGFGSTGIQ